MTETLTELTEHNSRGPLQALAGAVRHDPAALLQLLLSFSRKETFARIIDCPTYPAKVTTEDLQPRRQLLLERLKTDRFGASDSLTVLFESAVGNPLKRKRGLYFTPVKIARYAVSRLALGPGETAMDPGCGTGIFASELFRLLGTDADRVAYYGVEVDPLLALSTAICLDFMGAPLSWRVVYRNFLLIDRPQLSSLKIGAIDAIIANPPFVRTHRIAKREKIPSLVATRSGYHLSGYSGLHLLFLAQSAHLLKPRGRAVFLFPSEIVGAQYWSQLEQQLAKTFRVQKIEIAEPEAPTIRWLFHLSPHTGSISERSDSDKLSRQTKEVATTLWSIANVHRGISTGANDFFVLTSETVARAEISSRFLVKILPTKVSLQDRNCVFEKDEWQNQNRLGRACWLLAVPPNLAIEDTPQGLRQYLRDGVRRRIPMIPTCRNRHPWYSIRFATKPPPIIYTYMSRNPRFLYNKAGVHILTNLLGVQLKNTRNASHAKMVEFTQQLNRDFLGWIGDGSTGRMYAGGLRKFEPGDLRQMPISKALLTLARSVSISLDALIDEADIRESDVPTRPANLEIVS